MKRAALVGMMVIAGCRAADAENTVIKPVDPCSAQGLKLGTAKPLATWKIPDDHHRRRPCRTSRRAWSTHT